MHMKRNLIPFDHHARSVGTKDGIRRIFHIPLRVIGFLQKHTLLIVTGEISLQPAGKLSLSRRIGRHLCLIILQLTEGNNAGKGCFLFPGCFYGKNSLFLFQICHGSSHCLLRHGQGKLIPGLQKLALRLHQSLTQRPINRLPEIPALCMLLMGLSRHQRDLHICND